MAKALDLTGERYGNLTVIKRVENSKNGIQIGFADAIAEIIQQ